MSQLKVFIFFCLIAVHVYGQEEKLDTFIVKATQRISSISAISEKEIALFQPNDIGEIAQKLPGITLKNYGGMGGMKTLSVRGLSSVYQKIIMDGHLLPNTQTGQVDLGNIYASNVRDIELIYGGFSYELVPVGAILGANILSINRKSFEPIKKTYGANAKLAYGSFNSMEAFLLNRFKIDKKNQFSIGGNYRSSDGNYPYHFKNYSQIYKGKRVNADIKEINAELSYLLKISDHLKMKASYAYNQYDKGLPGTVILYLNTAEQRLAGSSHRANWDLNFDYHHWKAYLYADYSDEQLVYLDNGFLNTQGFLKSKYQQRQANIGYTQFNSLGKYFSHKYGLEIFGASLDGDISNDIQPRRWQGKAFYDFNFNKNNWSATARLSGQTLNDYNKKAALERTKYYFQPGVHLAVNKDWPIIGNIIVFLKRNVRVPGFNDLYYNQIGNKSLRPEISNQIQLSFQKRYLKNRMTNEYGGNVYFNQENDKIVAIPTKNLFVWMIQNVGKVEVWGTDMQYRWMKYWNDWNLAIDVNYTFQSVKDKTDPNSATFQNQIAYYPEHVGNLIVYGNWKKLGFSVATFAVSKRYALNENISSNEVKGYFTTDLQMSYQFNLQKTGYLTVRATCKNIANLQYAYVKYYVMPGINYLISIEYEF